MSAHYYGAFSQDSHSNKAWMSQSGAALPSVLRDLCINMLHSAASVVGTNLALLLLRE